MYRYVDAGPAPPATSEATSRVMRRTRRTGTAPELAVRRALHRRGLRYLVDVARRAPTAADVSTCCYCCEGQCPEHGQLP
ncbi:hypothetical protein [Lentzea sp. NEAU-D7]|uniref:hypothetical protein n=1 Tax=Lentzea sp. NEAU-D7 TaxID=2994667 RepID=UPI00224B8DF4|nr:hypothetical protein [Lentzea sp. NEAU-D7]MCX2954367.1 hypothetical protein [Lentzea sp. NEAU-D7]